MFEIIRQLWRYQIEFPFDSYQLKIDSNKPLEVIVDDSFAEIKQILCNDNELLELLDQTYAGTRFLLDIAPMHQCDPNIKANGYWGYIKLVTKFIKMLILSSKAGSFNREHTLLLLRVINIGLNLCRKIRLKEFYGGGNGESNGLSTGSNLYIIKGTDLFDDDNLFASKLDIVDLLELIQTLKAPLSCLYAYYNCFWLCPSINKLMQFFSAFMAIYSSRWKSIRLYNWISRYNRGIMFTNMSLNINIDCLQSMWSMPDFPIVRTFISLRNLWTAYSRSVCIIRQNRWKIDQFEPKVHDLSTLTGLNMITTQSSTVRCILIRSSKYANQSKRKSVLLHAHGGGFISQSPEFHQSYLNDWAQKLKDVTILSVDYSLSPQNPFPVALQEVLDCYLWLVSGQKNVESIIGFQPENVAICGDSAGGNLSMALALALGQIRLTLKANNEPLESVPLPKGLFCYYTPLLLTTIVSPSRMITSIDSLMPVGILLNCLSAYVPEQVVNHDDTTECDANFTTATIENSLIPFNLSPMLLMESVSSILSGIRNLIKGHRSMPWYKNKTILKRCLYNLNKFVSNPFISPLLASEQMLEQLEQMPLYLYPLLYDAFLDDSIEMAKKWKAKVHIEVIEDLPHGFLNMVKFSDEAKKASHKCMEHILDVL